jgi:archaellum component FlaC
LGTTGVNAQTLGDKTKDAKEEVEGLAKTATRKVEEVVEAVKHKMESITKSGEQKVRGLSTIRFDLLRSK